MTISGTTRVIVAIPKRASAMPHELLWLLEGHQWCYTGYYEYTEKDISGATRVMVPISDVTRIVTDMTINGPTRVIVTILRWSSVVLHELLWLYWDDHQWCHTGYCDYTAKAISGATRVIVTILRWPSVVSHELLRLYWDGHQWSHTGYCDYTAKAISGTTWVIVTILKWPSVMLHGLWWLYWEGHQWCHTGYCAYTEMTICDATRVAVTKLRRASVVPHGLLWLYCEGHQWCHTGYCAYKCYWFVLDQLLILNYFFYMWLLQETGETKCMMFQNCEVLLRNSQVWHHSIKDASHS